MKAKHEIVVLGPAAAGKTQLIRRLCGEVFVKNYDITQGIEQPSKTISDRKICFRDVSASNCDLGLLKHIKNAKEIYLVFDSHDSDGLTKLKTHISSLNLDAKLLKAAKITLIGTHADYKQAVGQDAILDYVAQLGTGAQYVAFSSLPGEKEHPGISALTVTTEQIEIVPKQTGSSKDRFGSSFDTNSETAEQIITAAALRKLNQQHSNDELNSDDAQTYIAAVDALPNEVKKQDKMAEMIRVVSSPSKVTPPKNQPHNTNSRSKYTTSKPQSSQRVTPPAPINWGSFALRMAGMAMILAGIIGLIYIALVIANILSALTLITLMNHIVTAIGGLFGASTSTSIAAFGNFCATLGVGTTTATGTIVTGVSVAFAAVGLRMFRAGQAPEAVDPGSRHTPNRSSNR